MRANPETPRSGRSVRIGVPDFVSTTMFPLLAAKELGCFAEAGLDVQIELFNRPNPAEALRAGLVDYSAGPAHGPLVAFPDWNGAKLLVALAQGSPWLLVMRSDLNTTRGDLSAVKGRRIAAARGPDLAFRHMLREAGIDEKTDEVQISPLPGASSDDKGISFGIAAAKALTEGRVDGIWANALGAEVAIHQGAGRLLVDARRGDGPRGAGSYSFAAVATTHEMIRREPAEVTAVITSVVRAQRALREDASLAIAVATGLFPPAEAELAPRVAERDAGFYTPEISRETADSLASFASAVGLLSVKVPYQGFVATEFSDLWRITN